MITVLSYDQIKIQNTSTYVLKFFIAIIVIASLETAIELDIKQYYVHACSIYFAIYFSNKFHCTLLG